MAANAPARVEQLRFRLLGAHDANGNRPHPEAQRDERRLGSQNEPEAERGERGSENADEVDRVDFREPEALERRVPAVAGEAKRQRDEDAGERGDEDHVPACRLAPVEPLRNDVPDEVDDVVDRCLEHHRRERDRKAEQRRERERAQVSEGLLVHLDVGPFFASPELRASPAAGGQQVPDEADRGQGEQGSRRASRPESPAPRRRASGRPRAPRCPGRATMPSVKRFGSASSIAPARIHSHIRPERRRRMPQTMSSSGSTVKTNP